MRPDTQKQLKVLAVLLVVYAALAAVAFLLSTPDELAAPGQSAPATISSIPRWELALANGGIALVIYAVFGLAAVWRAGWTYLLFFVKGLDGALGYSGPCCWALLLA